jgi:tetratricopeptide (TPR) repeat protein
MAGELIELALAERDLECAVEGYEVRFEAAVELGRLADARDDLDAMSRLADELRQPTQRWIVTLYRTFLALLDGSFESAERLLLEARSLGKDAQPWTAAATHDLQLFLLRREQGRLADVEALIRRAADVNCTYPIFRCALTSMLAGLGLHDEARVELEKLAAHDFAAVPFDEEWLVSLCLLSEAAVELRDRERSERLYELLAPFSDRVTIAYTEISLGPVARFLGMLAAALGRAVDADRHFGEAAELSARIGARPSLAHVQTAWARLRLDQGELEEASRLAADAWETYRELGMDGFAARAHALIATPA